MRKMTACLSALFALGTATLGLASSHREAPYITEHPKVDGTDFYMFRSYEGLGTGGSRENWVTFIANYQPLQHRYGGPNYFTMDPDALYEIHIENTGDANEDITYQFRFTNTIRDLTVPVNGNNISVPLINIGSITAADTSKLNVIENYTITQVTGDRRTGTALSVTNAASGSATFTKPVDYIGEKSLGNAAAYDTYAAAHVFNINVPNCATTGRVFVGQRADPFPVNLGVIFDLVNAVPIEGATNRFNMGANVIENENVTTFALELPISCLNNSGANPKIGGWTSASLRQGRVINPSPVFNQNAALAKKVAVEGGAWTQVSRLGNPLVNEVVIGLKDKDRFNTSHPRDDSQFLPYVDTPTLPVLLNALFGANADTPTVFPRTDLRQVFLTGVTGVNDTGSTAEMLRLNTGTAITALASQDELGALGLFNAVHDGNTGAAGQGNADGFPNGRRLGDDVVDIALRAVMGALLADNVQGPEKDTKYTDGATHNAEGVADAVFFKTTFPYLNTPKPGSP